ncbi:hypothetical protein BXT84_14095 [Sulfobacillus thermotolerans]|uniref:DUF2330 domain-containing protein n=1 Tax=Sulfobacillus thermotolerans TaxID=338644 RepID=A0ABN5H2G4_9FIRM|nr:hypothetical protein BXT84_14095 [Sulfobacillus thermotolerans]
MNKTLLSSLILSASLSFSATAQAANVSSIIPSESPLFATIVTTTPIKTLNQPILLNPTLVVRPNETVYITTIPEQKTNPRENLLSVWEKANSSATETLSPEPLGHGKWTVVSGFAHTVPFASILESNHIESMPSAQVAQTHFSVAVVGNDQSIPFHIPSTITSHDVLMIENFTMNNDQSFDTQQYLRAQEQGCTSIASPTIDPMCITPASGLVTKLVVSPSPRPNQPIVLTHLPTKQRNSTGWPLVWWWLIALLVLLIVVWWWVRRHRHHTHQNKDSEK